MEGIWDIALKSGRHPAGPKGGCLWVTCDLVRLVSNPTAIVERETRAGRRLLLRLWDSDHQEVRGEVDEVRSLLLTVLCGVERRRMQDREDWRGSSAG